jgi:hypothetical protein
MRGNVLFVLMLNAYELKYEDSDSLWMRCVAKCFLVTSPDCPVFNPSVLRRSRIG